MKHRQKSILPLILALLLLCGACAAQPHSRAAQPALPDGELRAVFFDVGQADCILISTGGRHMLVDAGHTGQDELLRGYLAGYGVSKLDYLVATHPHADHIGSMPAVIYAMESIGAVLMPQAIAATTVFEKLLDALEQCNLEITTPEAGDTFELGEATVEVLAPAGGEYADLNNYSLVLRLSFGQVNLLLAGDAEALSEAQQLQGGYELRAEVLKIGHHGSSSSTTEAYLAAVAPAYAVISCGKDNSYGHPHAELLARLAARQTQVYRTDECGTLVFTTDGQQFTVSSAFTPLAANEAAGTEAYELAENGALSGAEPTDEAADGGAGPADKAADGGAGPADKAADGGAEPREGYIGNSNSRIFHLPGCASLPAEHNRVYFGSWQEAVEQGYRACKICKPDGP